MPRELPAELQRLVALWWTSELYTDAKAAAIWNDQQPDQSVTATAIGIWRRERGLKRSGVMRAHAAALANGAGACPTPTKIRRECERLQATWTETELALHIVQPVPPVEVIRIHEREAGR